jgi:predicted PurR-regulated permease PerM
MINNLHRQKKLSFSFLLLLTAAALYLSFLIARPFLGAIVTATLLALSIYPLFALLLRYVRSRSAAAVLATLTVLVALLLPAVFVVNTLANETKAFYGWLNQQSSAGVGWEELLARLTKRPLTWIERETGISPEQLKSAALDRLRDASTSLLNWAKSLAVDITGTIVNTLIMLFTLFYFLRDGPSILSRTASILPLYRKRYDQLLKTISDSMRANFYAVIVVSLAQSALGAVGYWIAGLPNVLLWAVMTALFSVLPAVGAAAVWGVGVIYLGITGNWGRALFLLVYGTCVISVADNVIRSLALGGRVKMNALLVFLSLLGGVQAFGFIGLFLGPIIVSVTSALLTILAEERANGSVHPMKVVPPRPIPADDLTKMK